MSALTNGIMKNTHHQDANKNTVELLELMSAYQKSSVLFTLVELDLPELLGEKSLTAAELAQKLKIDPLAMERFMNAATSLGLFDRTEDGFSNSAMTESFLVKGSEFYLGGQVERHRKRSSAVWVKLTERLQKWQSGDQKKSAPESADQGAEAMTEQHNLALLHGFALAKAFDFSKYRRILDLGGGTGATSIALCRSFPKLETVIFDLPENIEIAEKFVEKENLQHRISVVGGDFKKDDLPDDFDVVLMANFMAVADAAENKRLLKNLYEKLPARGACILSGWIIDDSHLAPQLSILFCLEDICWNAPDVERSEAVYSAWLREAGFSDIKCEIYLEPTKILYGVKTESDE